MTRHITGFIHDLDVADVPPGVLAQARQCLLDLIGVAAAGSTTALSRIMRDHAARHLRGEQSTAPLLFDGRMVSPPGAALANAATIDAIDGHDGHRLTKGHAGAAILPAAVSVLADNVDATTDDLLIALVVGYEIANRAGIALHGAGLDYHSSGAWNALGAAAVGARALSLDETATRHALGIAEYHGPRAPMMRCVDHPTMVKDSSAWGAHAGVSAALLAAAGFTGAPAELLTLDPPLWEDLGERWTLLEQYLKQHPVCRWAHPAVEGALQLMALHDLVPTSIRQIEVVTFAAAARLATGIPVTTEVAQYSLPFPVAIAAVHGMVEPEIIAHPNRADEQVRRLTESMRVHESPDMTAQFPASRAAEVTVVLDDGRRLCSGSVTALGDPEQPLSTEAVATKFLTFATPVLGSAAAEQLLAQLGSAQNGSLGALLDQLQVPV
ncbi:MAG: hypothetical protein QOK16_3971 [Solirubrobacteraceae bacterium]|jgi:2-methylcitrate dehydratase PrpD|nr:hypothetical protein [Solirubrobacteraceae bacterium]